METARRDATPREAAVRTEAAAPVPLCVDLDNTLLRTDSLFECVLDVARQRFTRLLKLPFWLAQGRAVAKRKLAESCVFDPATLPYRQELIDDLKAEREHARSLVLATAADAKIADTIAKHLGLFELVLASNGRTNLKGELKREALAASFGPGEFDYVGDSADRPVWKSARRAWIVGRPELVARAKGAYIDVERTYPLRRTSAWRAFCRVLRPHQWVKNLLIFVPIAAAHSFFDWSGWIHGALMFVAFSLAASSGYIINDLLDVRSDRTHASKKTRPFAAGDLALIYGLAAPLLLAIGTA